MNLDKFFDAMKVPAHNAVFSVRMPLKEREMVAKLAKYYRVSQSHLVIALVKREVDRIARAKKSQKAVKP